MSLINVLKIKSKQNKPKKGQIGQSVTEYIITFTVLVAGIMVIFGAFNPDFLNIRSVFDQAINNAITQINRQ